MVTDSGYDEAPRNFVDVLVENPREDGGHVAFNDKVHGAAEGEHDVGDGKVA